MYGLVNLAIEELVIKVAGDETWQLIKADAGFHEPGFLKLDSYPDELTYRLVGSASKFLKMEPAEVLRAFGRHWVMFTSEKGYGDLLHATADNFIEFIDNLDTLHARVELSIDGLNLPSFDLEPTDHANRYLLHYYSDRKGLAPMVIGLVEGLAELFQESWVIVHLADQSSKTDHDVFELLDQSA